MGEYSYYDYQEYLFDQLDDIFFGEDGEEYPNKLRNIILEEKKEDIKVNKDIFAGKYGFLNSDYAKIGELHEGLAWVCNRGYNNYYKYIDKDGNEVIDIGEANAVGDFHEGLAWVKDNDGFKFINKKGHAVFHLFNAKRVGDFKNGHAWFTNDYWNYYFVDTKGIISTEGYSQVWDYCGNYAIVRKKNKYNVIDEEYKLVGNWQYRRPSIGQSHNFACIDNRIVSKVNYLDDYSVRKRLLGYECRNIEENEVIRTKYEPIKVYSDKYVLCLDHKCNMYIYDKENNIYTFIDSAKWVEFDDNFILSRPHFFKNSSDCFVVYFVYDGGIVDITEYYNKRLNDKETIKITHGLGRIFTFQEFQYQDKKVIQLEKINNVFGSDTLHRRRY